MYVVPNAADMPALAPGRAERTAPETKSLVYMGSFMPYKNVETLVRAAALLPDYTPAPDEPGRPRPSARG